MSQHQLSNPFEELYVSESIPARDYVRLFSSFLVSHAIPLFQPGNVVLMGVQGSGKSMLLSLLKPGVRLAYDEAGIEFPVPLEHRQFIGAGINLRRSGASNFGQRAIREEDGSESEQFPFYFADFVNYWIVLDLIESVRTFANAKSKAPAQELGVRFDDSRCNAFASELAQDSCWFGSLEGVTTLRLLTAALQSRISDYLKFFNYNSADIPGYVRRTKSAIGAPISAAARALRSFELIGSSCRVFVQIDQYEETNYIERHRPGIGDGFRRVVNRALGTRDEHASYRIGARGWAWRENLEMLGTAARIEQDREYREVNLDNLLRRKENRQTWIFPSFAEDVMKRRLEYAGFDLGARPPLAAILGSRILPEERARFYSRENTTRSSQLDSAFKEIPTELRESILQLQASDPLQFFLALAWFRQQRNKRRIGNLTQILQTDSRPWTREYWRKERVDLALFQLAADAKQRPIWAGKEDVLALSGGNVLVFVSICREIWSAYLRTQFGSRVRITDVEPPLPSISPATQSVGIENASRLWVEKIVEQPQGDTRKRFVELVARILQRGLLGDRALSNPGNNGFSLLLSDLEERRLAADFLRSAVDYGELVETPHTTKERNRLPRMKWYLRPIFSPYFRLPVSHTKEPIYSTIGEVEGWISMALEGRTQVGEAGELEVDPQLNLLDESSSE